jgi:2-keto-3-deoxy-L-rhamnonate aldolase RhmA
MKPARELAKKIEGDVPVTGVIATRHLWSGLVEIVRNAGLDYLIVDLEHGAFSDDLVAEVCTIGRLLDVPVLVRPVYHDYPLIRRAIDFGPCGFLLPCVDRPQTLDAVAEGIRMPPRGKRRPGGPSNRWLPDYHAATIRAEVEDDFIVLPQIESREGLGNADAIAAHELTTALAIGPYDLSAELGVCWEPESPVLAAAVSTLRAAAARAGKRLWMIGDGAKLRAQGFTFLCLGEPIDALAGLLAAMNRAARSS